MNTFTQNFKELEKNKKAKHLPKMLISTIAEAGDRSFKKKKTPKGSKTPVY